VSRKRGKRPKPVVEAIPDDILAEGSAPVGRASKSAVATVEDVVTTDDIATTEDVVTADDVVVTAAGPRGLAAAGGIPEFHEPVDGEPRCMPEEASIGDLADASPGASMDASADASARASVEQAEAAELDLAEPDATLHGAGADPDEPGDIGDDGDGSGDGSGDDAGGDDDDDDAVIVFPTSAATMDAVQLKHLVEALIFASDRPLTVQRLRQLTRVGDVRRLEAALVEIAEDYRERGLVLQQVSGGYQFRTRTQFSAWVQQLIAGRPVRLSRAQLETLAIIAYRQPITRPEIDDIRGVDSTATLKLLIDRMLIRVLGKREEVGRPMLYGTTKEFLDFFSLGDLRELPTLREYSELTAESRKVMSDRLGIAPDGDEGDGSGGSGDGGGGGGGGEGDCGPGEGGAGGDGGTGPIPGFDGDEGGAPANASASDLADAVATFLSAADVVERSNAAAMAGLEDDDAPPADAPTDDALADDVLADDALTADALVADVLAGDALADDEAGDVTNDFQVEEPELGSVAGPSLAAAEDVSNLEGDRPADGDGRVESPQADGDPSWPAGSQRFAVMASIDVSLDDREHPAEPPVMDPSPGDAEAPAARIEPAAE